MCDATAADRQGRYVAAERLSDRSVANLVKADNGASILQMMDVSRHKSVDKLRDYVRDAELFKDHAGAGCFDP